MEKSRNRVHVIFTGAAGREVKVWGTTVRTRRGCFTVGQHDDTFSTATLTRRYSLVVYVLGQMLDALTLPSVRVLRVQTILTIVSYHPNSDLPYVRLTVALWVTAVLAIGNRTGALRKPTRKKFTGFWQCWARCLVVLYSSLGYGFFFRAVRSFFF